MAQLFLVRGANIEAKMNNGKTALRLAEANGHQAIVSILKLQPPRSSTIERRDIASSSVRS